MKEETIFKSSQHALQTQRMLVNQNEIKPEIDPNQKKTSVDQSYSKKEKYIKY